jgi:membrane dipeptidase
MAPSRYSGYRSFSYLEAGADCTEFEPSADVGRLPPHDHGLTDDESARAERLLAENGVVSLHDHPVRLPRHARTELLHWNREAVEKYHAIEGGQQTLSNLAAYVTEIVREGVAN